MDKPKSIDLLNVSGQPLNEADWQNGDKALAVRAAHFIAQKVGMDTCISHTDDGVLLIDYAMHGRIQPTIKVEAGRLKIPKGSDFILVMALLSEGF